MWLDQKELIMETQYMIIKEDQRTYSFELNYKIKKIAAFELNYKIKKIAASKLITIHQT